MNLQNNTDEQNQGEVKLIEAPASVQGSEDVELNGGLNDFITFEEFEEEVIETESVFSKDTVVNEETQEPESVVPKSENIEPEKEEIEPPISQDLIEEKWRYWMKLRFEYQAKGLAHIAGNADLEKDFGISPTEFEFLVKAYSRAGGAIITKVPAWFEILIIESIVTGRQIRKALKIRNSTPPAPQKTQTVTEKVKVAHEVVKAQNEQKKESATFDMPEIIDGRKTDSERPWRLNENGCFANKPNGNYLKKELQTEKPDLNNPFVKILIDQNNN